MRKITLTSALCMALFSSLAVAQEPGPFNEQDLNNVYPDSMENYVATTAPLPEEPNHYIGLQVGGMYSQLKFTNSVTAAGFTQAGNTSKNIGSLTGGLFGGYGLNFDHFYIGGEASVNYNSLSKSTSLALQTPAFSPNTKITVKQPVIATIDLIPGYLTRPCGTLIYGRIGAAGSFAQVKLNADSGDPNNPISDTSNNFVGGFRVGTGLDFYVVDWFSVRTDYVYSSYAKIKNTFKAKNVPLTYDYGVTPTSHQVTLGFNFHW